MARAQALESPLEKKAGINYGPPGTRRLIYFVDDLNMPRHVRRGDRAWTGEGRGCLAGMYVAGMIVEVGLAGVLHQGRRSARAGSER